ncbi:MAG: hypothetical protein LBH40_03650 [Alphaproteobacteria bacterium]|jgi:hypothetical protein|nr:hypothetical protein [Alphaproteobacteria bacterium]
MKKLDYLFILIAMIIGLCLFTVYQIISNPEILQYLIKAGIFNNSKETLRMIILTFYSLIFTLFVVVAVFLCRILIRIARLNNESK